MSDSRFLPVEWLGTYDIGTSVYDLLDEADDALAAATERALRRVREGSQEDQVARFNSATN